MQQPHAGGEHLITGFRRAMGNRKALTEKGRALRFTRTQPAQITRRDQPVGDQNFTQQGQRRWLVRRGLMHVDVLCIQLKHGELLRGSRLLWPTVAPALPDSWAGASDRNTAEPFHLRLAHSAILGNYISPRS